MTLIKRTDINPGLLNHCILLVFFLLVFQNNIFPSNDLDKRVDSLTTCFVNEKSDTAKVLLLNEIASTYAKTLPDTSRLLLQKALSLAEQINFQIGLAKTYNNLAILARYCGNYQSAVDLISMALKIYDVRNYDLGKADCYDNLGVIYMEQGFYSKALDLFLKSVFLHEKFSDKSGIAYTVGNIGIVYKLQGDYIKAFEYFSKSLRLNEASGNIKGIAKAHNLLGTIYRIQNQYDEAILCYRKSYQISTKISDKFGMAYSMEYMAEVFQSRGKYYDAVNYNLQSMKLREDIGNTTGIAQNLYNIGNLYFLMKNFNLAESYIQKSLAISKKINLMNLVLSSYNILSELYYQKGDFKKSSEYFRTAKQMADTINNMQNAKKITQLVMNIEFDKKQKKLEEKERKKELQQLQDKNRQILLRNLFIVGFIFVLIIVFILFRFYRIKARNNDQLLIKNIEIGKKNEEILNKSALLESTNKELEKLSIVASKTENAVLIADIQGVIEWVNTGFTKLYGYTLEQFIVEQGANIIKASAYHEIHEAIFDCVCNKNSVMYTTKTKTRSGEKLWVQTTLTPILNEAGEVIKMIAIDSDITKMKLFEKEILIQKEELHAQSEQMAVINRELEKKNIQITDSIEYAKHIQDGILLTDYELSTIFPESFSLYKPRDIVSGDLYWSIKLKDRIFVAVIDCTGHGVSGAFMGMLGYAFLSEIVNKSENINASEVLTLLREKIISTLGKDDKKGSLPYGMDMSLCILSNENKNLQFSGANSPIYLVTKCKIESECMREVTVDMLKITHLNEAENANLGYHLIEVKANKLPIGLTRKKEDKFVNIEYKLEKGDMLYMFTDGFSDQFGGSEGWKFLTLNFKNLLLQNFNKSMQEQKLIYNNAIVNWMYSHEKMYNQTDDITLLGIRI